MIGNNLIIVIIHFKSLYILFSNQFCFCFRGSLVEKAYAKLLGSYDELNRITFSDFIVDLTGGVCEELSLKSFVDNDSVNNVNKICEAKNINNDINVNKDINDNKENEKMFDKIFDAYKNGSHIGCQTDGTHYYTITKVVKVTALTQHKGN